MMEVDDKENVPSGNQGSNSDVMGDGFLAAVDNDIRKMADLGSKLQSKDLIASSMMDSRDYAAVKNRFQMLKKAYRDSQLAQNFIERIALDDPLFDVREGVAVATAEIEMKKKKEKLRELKSKSKEMEAQFLEKTESLTQDHLKYEANNSRLKELFQELVEKKKQIAELRKKEPPTKAAPANLEECHEMLEQQTESIQTLNAKKQEIQEKLFQLRPELSLCEQELRGLEEVSQKSKPSSDLLDKLKEKRAQVNSIGIWYDSLNEVYNTLSGFSIEEFAENKLSVKYETGHLLHVFFEDDSTKIQGAEIEPKNVEVDDVIAYAMKHNDLPFMIREVRSKVFRQQHESS